MPDEQAIVHGACIQFLTHSTGLTTHRNPSLWGLVLLPPFSCGLFLFLVVYEFVSFCYHALSLHISLSVFYPWFSFPLRPFSICRLLLLQNWCGLSFHVSVLCLTNVGFVQSFSLKSFQACVLGLWYSVMFMLCFLRLTNLGFVRCFFIGSLHVCMLGFLFLTFNYVFVMPVSIGLLPHEFPRFQYSLHASVFLCTIPPPGYSVGRAPVCCAGGRGFDPQTGQTLRVLNNWGECAAFVIISANG